MRGLMVFVLLCYCITVQARKKNAAVKYLGGTMIHAYDSLRKVGDVYDFQVQTFKPNIYFTAVWFGATPVRCDVYEQPTNYRTDTARKPGLYHLSVNKDLYKNFPSSFDSTRAFPSFQPPISFRGEAIILYTERGKPASYLTVKRVKKVSLKGTRN